MCKKHIFIRISSDIIKINYFGMNSGNLQQISQQFCNGKMTKIKKRYIKKKGKRGVNG